MEPIEDDELKQLLRQWDAPEAPDHLRARVFGAAPASRSTRGEAAGWPADVSAQAERAKVEARPARRWRGAAAWLLTGSIRVPVPAVAVLLVLLAWLTAGRLLPFMPVGLSSERPVSLADFQPAAEMKVRIVGELP